MIVVLTGAPGAGKGTQADLLVAREGWRKLSTGDALRKHVKAGTEIGKVAAGIMEKGQLVPDDVLLKILSEELSGVADQDVVLLDGYPRNLAQAASLDAAVGRGRVAGAVHLDVPRAELVARLSGRRVCGQCGTSFHVDQHPPKQAGACDKCGGGLVQRPDDQPDSIGVRLKVYEETTKPVLDFYSKDGRFQAVSGVGALEEVYGALKTAIGRVKKS